MGWSPYAGRRLRGRVIAAFSRGVQVWDGERVSAPAGRRTVRRFLLAALRVAGPMPEAGLRCRGWRQEAILRLLENNLAIAERPEDLVVYAAHAKAARDHAASTRSSRALTTLEDGHTLV